MRIKAPALGKIAIVLAASMPVVLLVFLWIEHARGAAALANYKAGLVARGEAVRPSDLITPSGRGPNGARDLMDAAFALKAGNALPHHLPSRMQMTPSGRAVAIFDQPRIIEGRTNREWSELAEDLQANAPALRAVQKALEAPFFDHHLDYAGGPFMPLPHLAEGKKLSTWFAGRCQLALHENRLNDALDALLVEIRLPRMFERDRILISELVRIAMGSIAGADTWQALQADGWSDSQLQAMAKAWEHTSFLDGFIGGLEGERIFVSTTFEICRASNDQAIALLWGRFAFMQYEESPAWWEARVQDLPYGAEALAFLREQIYSRLWRFAWADQCERLYLERVQQLVEVARAARQTRSMAAAQARIDALQTAWNKRAFYDDLRFPRDLMSMSSLGRALRRAMFAETERSLALTAIALRRRALAGLPDPPALDALAPEYLPQIPIDYMDGKPIKYRPAEKGRSPLLYSSGDDGIDDGGDPSPKEGDSGRNSSPGRWFRKDCVWPERATAEEASDVGVRP